MPNLSESGPRRALRKVVAGGQTGVDAAALRAALRHGLQTGGWCPPDARNEAGPIDAAFGLTPTPAERSDAAPDVPRSLRTEWNVRDAEATLILLPGRRDDSFTIDPGTAWAIAAAERLARPLLVAWCGERRAAEAIARWLERLGVRVLNVAGPSEATAPGVERAAFDLLGSVFAA
jgi:hypothetical protein